MCVDIYQVAVGQRMVDNATVDIGKFLNGYTTQNYNITPKGWDHVDALVIHLLLGRNLIKLICLIRSIPIRTLSTQW